MTDRRLTPFSGQVALNSLRGTVPAPAYTEGTPARVMVKLADLHSAPGGPRERQMPRGAALTVIETRTDIAFIQARADGYCGWIDAHAIGPDHPVTHRVIALATHSYSNPDLKSPETGMLSINSLIRIIGQEGRFLQTDHGEWLPQQHLARLDAPASDPVTVAEALVGVPYLWGGNSCWGIDCSGLVQLAYALCNTPCPADSDLQALAFREKQVTDATLQRGDLLFWRGHVAFVRDADTLLHATAWTMSVIPEALTTARPRIEAEAAFVAHVRP